MKGELLLIVHSCHLHALKSQFIVLLKRNMYVPWMKVLTWLKSLLKDGENRRRRGCTCSTAISMKLTWSESTLVNSYFSSYFKTSQSASEMISVIWSDCKRKLYLASICSLVINEVSVYWVLVYFRALTKKNPLSL